VTPRLASVTVSSMPGSQWSLSRSLLGMTSCPLLESRTVSGAVVDMASQGKTNSKPIIRQKSGQYKRRGERERVPAVGNPPETPGRKQRGATAPRRIFVAGSRRISCFVEIALVVGLPSIGKLEQVREPDHRSHRIERRLIESKPAIERLCRVV
jgi:hypothetical protein